MIEKRLAVTQALAEQTDSLLNFVRAREEDPDLDSEMMQFLRDQGLTLTRADRGVNQRASAQTSENTQF